MNDIMAGYLSEYLMVEIFFCVDLLIYSSN